MNTPSNKAYLYLVRILSGRDYSEHRLREKLAEKQYSTNEIESAITDIKARGFLRADAYAETRIKGFMHRGYSSDYIRQKLAEEHLSITDETIESVFKEYGFTSNDQIDRLIRKKIQRKAELDYDGESKILRYLLSKGHDFVNSKKILKSIIGELASQNE